MTIIFSFSKESDIDTEKGSVMIIFAVFMMAMIPLLALSIDTYFMAQGRLEEQNLAEYAALTSLDGYVKVAEVSNDHSAAKTEALAYLKSIEGDNGVTGLTEGSGWNFTPENCEGNQCSGGGWTLKFGSWDGSTFYPAVPETSDPESIPADLVDAVRITMEIPDGGFVDYLRTSTAEEQEGNSVPEGNIKLPASAIAFVVRDGLGNKFFRLIRKKATGSDEV